MTWAQLYILLKGMEASNHTSFNNPVQLIVENVVYDADVIESLTTGDAYIVPAIETAEEEADG